MFSATFPEDIQHLAGRFLNNYLFVAVGIVGGASTDVEQIFHQVTKYEKQTTLKKLIEENGESLFIQTFCKVTLLLYFSQLQSKIIKFNLK